MGYRMYHAWRLKIRLLAGWLLLSLAPLMWAASDPLPPDQVFPIAVRAEGTDQLLVTWDIAQGHYLYKNKIRFSSDTPGVRLGAPLLPEPEIKQDPFFGETPIFRGRLQVRLPITRDPSAPNQISLEAQSQGCSDQGICYPPHRQTLQLELASQAPAAPPPAVQDDGFQPLDKLSKAFNTQDPDAILPAEDAFRFQATPEGPDRLRLVWTIAPGTFLYRENLRLRLEGAPNLSLGEFAWPPAERKSNAVRPDGEVGDVELYHDRIEVSVPLRRDAGGPVQVTLVAEYQGCAERGICYPPQRQRVELTLPAFAGSGPPAPAAQASPPVQPAVPQSEQDQIADSLRSGGKFQVIASFFGLGLLLAFTPCLFPMIPILSGIIAGQGRSITPRRAFILSLVYVLAMSVTYTLAGIAAGLFGQNLQALFQNPWILSSFALVFVGLALSMFGFFDLQLPASLQGRLAELSNRQRSGSLTGVAIMGLLSALIVGPCVAPPLAGALIFIGQTGDWVLGGMALFALAMGSGLPLIAIGTSAGQLLPRAGRWMDSVKAVFGVLMLAVAIQLLERILPESATLALWGVLLVCSSVYLGATRELPVEATGWARLWKGLGLVLLIQGALMLVGAAGGGKDSLQPLRGLLPGPARAVDGGAAALDFKAIKSLADLDRERAAAQAAGQALMLDFYADWCSSCKELERDTFSDPKVIGALAGLRLLRADVTANDPVDQALLKHFDVQGPPTIIFYAKDGRERRELRLVGFLPANRFLDHLGKLAP